MPVRHPCRPHTVPALLDGVCMCVVCTCVSTIMLVVVAMMMHIAIAISIVYPCTPTYPSTQGGIDTRGACARVTALPEYCTIHREEGPLAR